MNAKLPVFVCILIALAGCEQNEDLQKYVEEVKAKPAPPIEPLPTITPYTAATFGSGKDRDPFINPQPEQGQTIGLVKEKCLQPDMKRVKEDLEQFSLDNLAMKGSLADSVGLWALIQAPGGTVYRVANGQYMGLNYGKVTQITKSEIKIEELVPDNNGCWNHRTTVLSLNNSATNSNKKQG